MNVVNDPAIDPLLRVTAPPGRFRYVVSRRLDGRFQSFCVMGAVTDAEAVLCVRQEMPVVGLRIPLFPRP